MARAGAPDDTTPGAPPIATATVAALYLRQGKLDQAEQMYRALLARTPGDSRLTEGLAEIQRRKGELERTADTGDCVVIALQGETLLCRWRVTDEGRARAGLMLDSPAELVLRAVPFPTAACQRPVDTPLIEAAGEITLAMPPAGATVLSAAVGLLGPSGAFVSIAHCHPLSLRPGASPADAERPGDMVVPQPRSCY